MAIDMQIDPSYDYILTERGNTSIKLRKIQWSPKQEFKLDLRKYMVGSDGEERPNKGCCFDDETGNELTNVLVSTGYGDTREIIKGIKDREDFQESLAREIPKVSLIEIMEVQENLPEEVNEDDDIEFYDIRGEFND